MNLLNYLNKKVPRFIDIEYNTINTFLNPYSYLVARKNATLYERFDHIYIDGILLVIALKLLRIKKTIRASFDFTSFARIVIEHCEKEGRSIYFIGSKQNEIEDAIIKIKRNYRKLNIAGYRNGYYKNQDELSEMFNKIVKINPDFVVVGMGTPKQDEFLIKLKESGWNGTGYTCGGFLHQIKDGLTYFPQYINKFHLRWFYRMLKEKGVFKRILEVVLIFFPTIFYDFVKFKLYSQK